MCKKNWQWCLAVVVLACVVLFGIGCKKGSTTAPNSVSVVDFCLKAGDISGWTPTAGLSCQANNSQLLEHGTDGSIDGGAELYIDHGLAEWIYNDLVGASGKEILVYVYDQGNAANATDVFGYRNNIIVAQKIKLTNYALTDASMIYYSLAGQYLVLAHFGRFHFELTLNALANETEAQTTADIFLKTYQARM